MLLFFVCISCCVLYYFWKRVTVLTDEPPSAPGALPLIGHLHLILGSTTRLCKCLMFLSTESLKLGGISKVTLGPLKYYVLTDPIDSLKAVNGCPMKSGIYNLAKRLLGEGLLTSNGEKWRTHRKLLNPMFTQQTINNFVAVLNEQARQLVSTLDEDAASGPFEYEHRLMVWSLESLCKTVMGVDIAEEKKENNNYVHAIDGISKCLILRATRPWLHIDCIYDWSTLRKEEDNYTNIIKNRLNQVLLERKKILRKYEEHGLDTTDTFRPFIDHILMLSTEKEVLSDEEVLDEVNILIAAGYDTTAQTMCFILMMLGAHKEIQDRAYKELESIFENSDRDIEKYDLLRLVYLEAIIKETLRFFPSVPIYLKRITSDIKLSKYTLRAGSDIVVSALGMCRHPVWGADADQFRPERWLDATTLPDSASAFPVFGLGKRSCIGRNYALMSMKIALAHILRRYIIYSYNDNPTMKMEIVLKCASPQLISLERRNKLNS